jgi:hypothetical protein
MADIFIKNPTGEIWKNSDGAILKAKKLNEMPIQQGLEFWSAADPAYLTIIDGLVSEAYDLRGTGQKMIQPNIVNRFTFINGIIYASYSEINKYLYKTNVNIKTGFIVMKAPNITQQTGLWVSNSLALWTNSADQYTIGLFFRNNIKYNITASVPNIVTNRKIMHTLTDFNQTNITLRVHDLGYGPTELLEWGWYDRVLTEMEVIYNINALNAKYSIF